jgi:hypothetical protein
LQLGWNLIALPLVPPDPAPAALLAAIAGKYDQVDAYHACDAQDTWKVFRPNMPLLAGNDLVTLDITMGFWISSTVNVSTLTIAGALPGVTAIPLCPGWNLIGYPSQNPVPLPEALAGIAGQYDSVYTYDASDPADPWKRFDPSVPSAANDLHEMKAGVGYWISANQAVTLTVR